MVLLGSIVTIISTRVLTDPINEIIEVLKKQESGDMKALIKEQKIPEFQMIASTFNSVVKIKGEQEREMEKQVEKRTNEVIRLTKENMRLRIIEEKERMYSNLHDSLGARLTGINISNQVAKVALQRDENEKVHNMLERIDVNTSKAILDLKEILLTKDNDIIEIEDFNNFIITHIKERLDLKQVTYAVDIPIDAVLELVETETLITIMRITEELVTNTLKYSEATKVEIAMSLKNKHVVYSYKDNGKGFDVKKAIKKGFGLPGIHQRVERLGGTMNIYTKLTKGATYILTFPLELIV
jgi:signal transduction histidine kinase